MDASHATGAGIGTLAGALLVGLLHHFRVTSISDADAALVGAAAAALGVGLAHAFWTIGLGPIFRRLLHGPDKSAVIVPPLPPVTIP